MHEKKAIGTRGDSISIVLVLFIWVSFSCMHCWWLFVDTSPPWGNGVADIVRAMHIFSFFADRGFFSALRELFSLGHMYPPFVDALYASYYVVFGVQSEMEQVVNIFFVGVALIGMYGLGKYFFNKKTGVIATLIFCSVPAVLSYSKLGFREFQLMCMLPITIFCLFASENFCNRKYAILSGFTMGLLLLTKVEGSMYLVVPLISITWCCFVRVPIEERSHMKRNIFYAACAFFLVAGPWYLMNGRLLIEHLLSERLYSTGVTGLFFTAEEAFFYVGQFDELLTMPYVYVSLAVFLSAIVCFVAGVRNDCVKGICLLGVFFVVPLLVWTFLSEKDTSHILPLVIFPCLCIAAGCSTVTKSCVRNIYYGSIVLYACSIPVVVYAASFFPQAYANTMIEEITHKLRPYYYGFFLRADREGWESIIKHILAFVLRDYHDKTGSEEKPFMLLLANNEPFRFFQFEYYNYKRNNPVNMKMDIAESDVVNDMIDGKYDYLVVELPMPHITHPEEDRFIVRAVNFIQTQPEQFSELFELVHDVSLPRNTSAKVYRYRVKK